MDETLLRRLVGAVVLFIAAFLLTLALPDPERRGAGAERTVSYDLNAPAAGVPDPLPDAPAPEPEAGRGSGAPEAPEEPRGWYVQVGSFESQDNARKALQDLYQRDLPAMIQTVRVGNAIWYRVRVGPYTEEDAARRVLDGIPKSGFKGARVVHVGPETSEG